MTFLNFKACRRSCFFPIYSVLHLLYNTRRCHVAVHFFFFLFVFCQKRISCRYMQLFFFSSFFTRLETGPTRHVDDERPSKFLISSVIFVNRRKSRRQKTLLRRSALHDRQKGRVGCPWRACFVQGRTCWFDIA